MALKKSLRTKFQKREQDTLQKIYDDREKRLSGSSGGSIFNQELLEKFEIEEFKPHEGENFVEILPCSMDSSDPYFREIAVHMAVGISNEPFVCMQMEEKKKACFRCEEQRRLYKKFDKANNEIIGLYPSSRCVYFVWDRTEELGKEDEPKYILKIWNAPKNGFHTELQSQVRDKKKKKLLDISELGDSKDSDGRTVYFKIVKKEAEIRGKKAKIPTYEGIDLVDRDEEIPDEMVEKISTIIEEANDHNKSAIDFLIVFPKYEELKEAMSTEVTSSSSNSSDEENEEEEKEKDKKSTYERLRSKKNKQKQEEITDIDELEEQLENMDKKEILEWIAKRKDEDLTDLIETDMKASKLRKIVLEYFTAKLEEF